MSRKIIYGDPRRSSDFLSEFDVIDDNSLKDLIEERKKQEEFYNSVKLNVPEINTLYNVRYVGLSKDYYTFDGDFKDYVRVENKQSESKYLKNTNIGDYVDVYISSLDENSFLIKGSIAEIYESRARRSLTSLGEGVSVKALIREITPAGYSVEVDYEGVTLAGFMPNTLAGINKLHDPESIVGSKLDVMIESFSRDEGTYIVSRRKYLQTLIPEATSKLEYDVVYSGHVTGTRDFGVFVEFNECLTGMIHKTNINPEWADKISQITPGFEIDFYVKEIIKDKIILTQILRDSLWDTIKIGQVINGKVKDNKQFGVLVMLDNETNGLIHASEMDKYSRSVQPGQDIKVKVLSVDRSTRKIFLTIL